ncbi:hypothetical protein ACIRPK_16280 [Kitasatospora sp. NPDC101801]|uniref:hypothetical protein n=1 Tax=Kitasatospora sp. NPDC101801 TaxID=3364103 RepID=UPI0037FF21F9
MTNTDPFAAEAEPAPGPVCPRCEESTRLSVFEELRRPVPRSTGTLPLLAAAALGSYGVAQLAAGNPVLAATLLGCALASGALAARAVNAVRTGELAQVLYCHHCLVRFRPGDQADQVHG